MIYISPVYAAEQTSTPVWGYELSETPEMGYEFSQMTGNHFIFFISLAVTILIAIFTVGFLMVFLNMATDIRIIRRYLTEK
jgi:uncharacterized membrane protein